MITLIEDSRQQAGKHAVKQQYFEGEGVEILRCKLPFGDYAFPAAIAVDTKNSMDEIAGNIGGGREEHQRFKRECIRARDAGCKLVFLIENTCGIRTVDDVHKWKNPRSVYSTKCIQGDRLEKAMKTMSERYGCEFQFCAPEESGARILEILGGGTFGRDQHDAGGA